MEKTKKSKKFRKKIGYLAVLAISFGLVVFMSVGATLAWFAGSDWADNTMYMGGPVYISMYGEDNTGRKLTSGFGNLEVSAATDSRTTGITSLTGDEENDKKVLLPGQRMEIHAVARLKSSAYETSYRRATNTGGLQNGTEGELSRSTNALLRARFALDVKFDSDTAVGESDFYTLPTSPTKPATDYTSSYKYYVSGPGVPLPSTPYDIINGVKTPATVGAIVEDNTKNDKDAAGNEYKNYYYEITIKSTNIITPDAREWYLPTTEEGNVDLGVGTKIWAWTRLDGYGKEVTPYANPQDLINALNTNMMQLIVESNAVGAAKADGAKWGWRYIPAAAKESTDIAQITMPNGTDKYNIGYDNNGAGAGDVAGWWYLVKVTGDIDVTDNDFTKLNTNGNAEMFEIDTRNFTTGNTYDGNAGVANEIPFVDGEFVLPGDMLDNIYGNAKIDFKITFQAIQAFLPWQTTSESNFTKAGTGAEATAPDKSKMGTGKDLTIGNAYIIFDEAFNNEAYKATQKPKNSQGQY